MSEIRCRVRVNGTPWEDWPWARTGTGTAELAAKARWESETPEERLDQYRVEVWCSARSGTRNFLVHVAVSPTFRAEEQGGL